MYSVRVESTFSSAHFLSGYKGKCENLHGHNYRVRVWIRGSELDSSGMLVDFGVAKAVLKKVVDSLDHSLLNDKPEFRNSPSAERIARYVFDEMSRSVENADVSAVDVYESDTSMARYEPS